MKIKRIIPIVTVVFCCMTFNAESSVFLDITGIYTDTGTNGNLPGIGLTVNSAAPLEQYLDNTKLYVSLYAAGISKNRGNPSEEDITFLPLAAGVRYSYPVMNIPLFLELSAGAGAAFMMRQGPEHYGPYTDQSETRTDIGVGIHFELLAGVNYRISQPVAVMFQGGYHFTRFFSSRLPSDASGWQFNLGISCTISGKGKELDPY